MAGIFLTNQLHHPNSSRTCGKKMADNNSAVVTAAPSVGQMTEDTGPTDAGDDDDPLSENQDHPEETMFITQTAPPENQCVTVSLGLYVVYDITSLRSAISYLSIARY